MFLRIYTIFFLLLYFYNTFFLGQMKHYGIWEWLDIPVMLCAIGGAFLYSYEFRFLTRKFWEYYFYLFIIYELVYMTWLQMPLLIKIDATSYIFVTNIVNLVLMAPLAYSLFRLQERWDTASRTPERK